MQQQYDIGPGDYVRVKPRGPRFIVQRLTDHPDPIVFGCHGSERASNLDVITKAPRVPRES